MLILLLFNDKPEFTYKEITDALQIDVETVRKNIQCLSLAKNRILNVTKAGQPTASQSLPAVMSDDVEMGDGSLTSQSQISTGGLYQEQISLNESFTSNFVRVALQMPVLEEVFKKEKVMDDRGHAIDAAVVRIMKTRKRLEMSTLM
jgi:hypothetical protein